MTQDREVIDWESLQSAQKLQAALECEILANSTRIEVFRSVGRSLIEDSCQPSSQVEEMLGELEGRWGELKRYHQDMETLLEEAEKALEVLGELSDIEDVLEHAETTLPDCTPESDVPMIRKVLQEQRLLESEVWASGAKLQTLRENRHSFPIRNHLLFAKIERKIEAADGRFRSLESELDGRVSNLKNSLALAELLKELREEESPVREERARYRTEAEVAAVAGRMEELVYRAETLTVKVQDTEDNMTAMETAPDPEELLDLLHQQEALELAADIAQGEAGELRDKAERLAERNPALAQRLGRELEGTQHTSTELAARNTDNRHRLQRLSRLETFLRNYRALVWWTEEPDNSTSLGVALPAPEDRELQPRPAERGGQDLDWDIQRELEELEELAEAGVMLVEEDPRGSVT
uniref:spectrin alpha chain, non-erythrocytic 1-like n=1 Tax=Pristiophorus japonicus TaxID=55135 RepID=UPI00398E9CEB